MQNLFRKRSIEKIASRKICSTFHEIFQAEKFMNKKLFFATCLGNIQTLLRLPSFANFKAE